MSTPVEFSPGAARWIDPPGPVPTRLLGLDWGAKRFGLAFADELGVPMLLPALTQTSPRERLRALSDVLVMRRVNGMVVGYPLNMNGSVGFKAQEVDAFLAMAAPRLQLPIYRADERLTTRAAEDAHRAVTGRGKADRKTRTSGEIDSRAALLILSDFLAAQDPTHGLLPPEEDELD